MKKNKKLPALKEQKDKPNKKIDYNIYGIRKEEDFVKIDRPLPRFYETMWEKNGACLVLSAFPGSGKTSYMQNLIGRDEYFKDLFTGGIYIISPTINNDIGAAVYRDMADFISDDYSEELAQGIYNNILGMEKEDRHPNIIIFDDCIGQFKQRTIAGKMASTCRHMKSLVCFSTQQIKALPPIIRANISHMVIWHCPSSKEFQSLVEINAGMGGEDNFIKCYNEACSMKYGMLLCDYRDMKMYKHTPDTGEPVEIWSRYDENGNLNLAERPKNEEIKIKENIIS